VHELSIAQSLVKLAAEQAAVHGAVRIIALDVVLGALSGLEPDALSFCFPVAARQTPCEGAELRLTVSAARGRCAQCGASAEVRDLLEPCARCGSWPLAVEGGDEMRLRSLEVA
jgi:hydrogenase nickel incorporation protein HypA/HybF